VDDYEEERCARAMHVANQPSPWNVAHDVLDGGERLGCGRLEVHCQEDAGQQLVDQCDARQGAEQVPDVEVLWCVVRRRVRRHKGKPWEACLDPAKKWILWMQADELHGHGINPLR